MPHRCPVTLDCQGTGVDAQWPLIMNRFPELRSGYILCEDLEFETPTAIRRRSPRLGGLVRWLETQSAQPEL